MKHELKIWPQYFEPVSQGLKTFQIRKNDRGFQAGDTVVLREWDPELVEKITSSTPLDQFTTLPKGYTGNRATFSIGYVLSIDDERVVFSLCPRRPGGSE